MILNVAIGFIFLTIAYMQALNFIKYRLTNGANKTRIVLFVCNLAMIVHVFRHVQGHNMYFLGIAAVGMAYLYFKK